MHWFDQSHNPLYLEKIELNAFRKCSGLISITLPDRVTDIENFAFHQCSNLERIYFTTRPPTTGINAFSGTPATLYYLPDYSWAWPPSLGGNPTVLWNPTFAGTTHSAGQLALTIIGTRIHPTSAVTQNKENHLCSLIVVDVKV